MPKKIAPTKITGGGGDFFEDEVLAYFMLCLLSETPPLEPALGTLVSIDCQTRASGWFLDDILLTLSSSDGESKASFSVKSYPQFSETAAPSDFVKTAWEQYLHLGTTKFDKTHDFFGLITTPHGVDQKRDIDGLLRLTRAQTPADFVERIEQPGFVSETKRELFQSFNCPRSLVQESAPTLVDTAILVSRLYVLEFDFESNNSQSLVNALQLCRSALISEALDEAETLWRTLVSFAAELRPIGGHVDLSKLIAHLRGKILLKTYPSHRRDWERLIALTNQSLSVIPDKIGQTVSISREAELTALEEKLKNANVVVLLGPSGCGKTVIAKTSLQRVLKVETALWWNAKSFDVVDYAAFESKYGLTFQLNEILSAAVGEHPTVVIDGIDRIFSESAFANLSTLIRIVETENSAWRVIVTCQPEEWERVQDELARVNISIARWATLSIGRPALEDLTPVWEAFPRLHRLGSEPHLQTLLLNPKVLDLFANRARIGEDVATQTWVGESDLINWFWNSEVARGPKATVRSNFLKQLGEKQADELDVVTAVSDVSAIHQDVIDELIHERLCVLRNEQLSFGHDLYGDWARQRMLLGHEDHLAEYLRLRLGSPLWNRAIRLFGIHLLESNLDTKTWMDTIEKVESVEGGNLAVDLLLESVIFAANPLPLYEKLWPELVTNNGKLLNRLLGRFLHVATIPNPMMVAFAKEFDSGSDASYAAMNRLPIWTYWIPMIRVLHQHSEEVIKLALVRVAEVANVWLRQMAEDWPLRKEAAELGIDAAQDILKFKAEPHHIIKDDIDQRIFAAGLAGARELPERVSRFALTACARITEESTSKPARRTLRTVLGEEWRPRTVARWPDGPKGNVDDAFRKLCLTSDALQPMILAKPTTAQEIILALLIEESVSTDEDESILLESLGTTLFYEWFPPLFFHGPFLYFLRNKPTEGLDLIIRLVNFVAQVWGDRHAAGNRRFSIGWQDEEREWFGNGDMYFWYRDQSHCPDTVVAALMSLEKWLYEELDAGRDVTPHIQQIISSSNNIAFAGLLSAVGRKNGHLLHGILSPLLGVSHFLIWEKQYGRENHDYLMMGWTDKDPRIFAIARDWHNLPHRKVTLYETAQWAYLNLLVPRHLFDDARARWEQELLALPRKATYWKGELEELIQVFTIDNYKTEARDGKESWTFVAPAKLRTKAVEARKVFEEQYPILSWPSVFRKILDAGGQLREDYLEDFWNQLQRVAQSSPIKAGPFGDDVRPEHAMCAGIAVLLLRHGPWLEQVPERKAWCVEQLTKTVLYPPEDGPLDRLRSDGTGREWSSFCAEALPHLWVDDLNSPLLRECVARLAVNSKYLSVAILFATAAKMRETLGRSFLQLRHLVHRWAGKTWSDRVAKDEARRKAWVENTALDEDAIIDSTEWLELAEEFVAGSLSDDVPSFRQVLKELEPRIDVFSEEETCPEFTDLNLLLIQATYSWLPALNHAVKAQERAHWLSLWHEMLDGTCERFQVPLENNSDSYGTPYGWDRWVFDRVAGLILEMRVDEHPENYWGEILSIGPDGHYWLEDFFLSWFRRGIRSAGPETFIRQWRRMSEEAFTLPKWKVENRKHLYDHQRIWWYLLGMSQHFVECWSENQQTLVDGMKDIYERWATSHLDEPMSALQFAAFLRLASAQGLRLDGILWLQRHGAEADEKYWKEYNIQDVVAEVLDKCWTQQRVHLRSKPEYFTAFKNLLSKLAGFQNPLALEIQRRIAAASP